MRYTAVQFSRAANQAIPFARAPPVLITLFTRKNCSLCDDAKKVLARVWEQRPFRYTEIDIMTSEKVAQGFRDLYEFDTPVVSNLN